MGNFGLPGVASHSHHKEPSVFPEVIALVIKQAGEMIINSGMVVIVRQAGLSPSSSLPLAHRIDGAGAFDHRSPNSRGKPKRGRREAVCVRDFRGEGNSRSLE